MGAAALVAISTSSHHCHYADEHKCPNTICLDVCLFLYFDMFQLRLLVNGQGWPKDPLEMNSIRRMNK